MTNILLTKNRLNTGGLPTPLFELVVGSNPYKSEAMETEAMGNER